LGDRVRKRKNKGGAEDPEFRGKFPFKAGGGYRGRTFNT